MNNITKIFVSVTLLFVIIVLCSSIVSGVNMNLVNPNSTVDPNTPISNEGNNSIVQENTTPTGGNTMTGNIVEEPSSTNTTETTNEQPASTTTSSSSSEENQDFFTADNILSIFLITIGVILILLAIAIFIRIK